jgi:hypothetical protein
VGGFRGGGGFGGFRGGGFAGRGVGGFRGGPGFRGGFGGRGFWGFGWGYPYGGYPYAYGYCDPIFYNCGYAPYDYGYTYYGPQASSGPAVNNQYYPQGSQYAQQGPQYTQSYPQSSQTYPQSASGYQQNYPQQSYSQQSFPQSVQNNALPQQPAPPARSVANQPFYRTPDFYLIAFTNHTIQAAVSFSVEGETLHYATREHVDKTAPLSTVDVRFSQQINRDRHVEFKMPQPATSTFVTTHL